MLTVSFHTKDDYITLFMNELEHKEKLYEKLKHFATNTHKAGVSDFIECHFESNHAKQVSTLTLKLSKKKNNTLDIADIIHLFFCSNPQLMELNNASLNHKLAKTVILYSSNTIQFEFSSCNKLSTIETDFEDTYVQALKDHAKELKYEANYRLFGLSLETFLKIDGITNESTPTLIAITGASGSGKSTLLVKIKEALLKLGKTCETVYFDNFYKPQPNISKKDREKTNYDVPDALDISLFLKTMRNLKSKQSTFIPCYSFQEHTRTHETELKKPAEYIIIDGIFALHNARARALFNTMIYVESDLDLVFIRRLLRDTKERGRDIKSITHQYLTDVRDSFFKYIEPTKNYAHLVVSNNGKHCFDVNVPEVIKFITDNTMDSSQAMMKPLSTYGSLFKPAKTQVTLAALHPAPSASSPLASYS
ncbi:MAG: uridine kinase [Gammaproteobacteria bacterium]|nr:uridine kinase [Gammaproteobacteria bacterium]